MRYIFDAGLNGNAKISFNWTSCGRGLHLPQFLLTKICSGITIRFVGTRACWTPYPHPISYHLSSDPASSPPLISSHACRFPLLARCDRQASKNIFALRSPLVIPSESKHSLSKNFYCLKNLLMYSSISLYFVRPPWESTTDCKRLGMLL